MATGRMDDDVRNTGAHTCVCPPFSGASLVGREEYAMEHSPSFLGSIGLFGRSGIPVKGVKNEWYQK